MMYGMLFRPGTVCTYPWYGQARRADSINSCIVEMLVASRVMACVREFSWFVAVSRCWSPIHVLVCVPLLRVVMEATRTIRLLLLGPTGSLA